MKSNLSLLPTQAADKPVIPLFRHKIFRLAGLIVFVLLALLITGLMIRNNPSAASQPRRSETVAAQLPLLIEKTVTQTPPPTLTSEPSRTPVKATPTLTSVPSTATALPPHLIETPVGLTKQFVVHLVREGESTTSLAKKYGTTELAIRMVNYRFTGSLWANSVVVIPLNQTDVSGVPPLSAYAIIKNGMNLESLALEQSVDKILLAQINGLPVDYIFSPGEWVLVPHPQATP